MARGEEELEDRTARQVLRDHLQRRSENDLEADLQRNYAGTVRVFSAAGVDHGHDGVRECAAALKQYLPNMRFEVTTELVDDDVAYLEWTAEGMDAETCDGADAFVIRNGKILAQTVHYTVHPKLA